MIDVDTDQCCICTLANDAKMLYPYTFPLLFIMYIILWLYKIIIIIYCKQLILW